jgi:hypothetical protein
MTTLMFFVVISNVYGFVMEVVLAILNMKAYWPRRGRVILVQLGKAGKE